jgi:hypothetical protein
MEVPSWDFHEMTSAVPTVQSATCAVKSVSFRGAKLSAGETKSSAICVWDSATSAMVLKSFENETSSR